MNKHEFLKELEGLLFDISNEERLEALSYYANYFDDAGIDREQIIISELRSPAKVAAIIKADLGISSSEARNRGYFTENGYEDEFIKEQKYEIIGSAKNVKDTDNTNENSQTRNGQTNREQNTDNSSNYDSTNRTSKYDRQHNNNSGTKLIIIIILCIFGLPFILPVIAVAFSLLITVGVLFLSLWIAFTVISIALTFTSVGLIIVGIIRLFTIPIIGLSLTGVGLVLFGIGLLFTMATIGLSTKVIPTVFRGFISICRLPFKNRRVPA